MIRKRLFLLLIVALASACSSAPDPKQKIMEAVEAQMEMPSRALSLSDYVKVYAYLNDREVVAAFYAPGPAGYDLNEVCFGGNHKVVPCGPHQFKQTKLRPGQRLWIDRSENLPDVSGGGCGYIRVRYDLQTNRITQTECNGPK
jgi:hypothetical protein